MRDARRSWSSIRVRSQPLHITHNPSTSLHNPSTSQSLNPHNFSHPTHYHHFFPLLLIVSGAAIAAQAQKTSPGEKVKRFKEKEEKEPRERSNRKNFAQFVRWQQEPFTVLAVIAIGIVQMQFGVSHILSRNNVNQLPSRKREMGNNLRRSLLGRLSASYLEELLPLNDVNESGTNCLHGNTAFSFLPCPFVLASSRGTSVLPVVFLNLWLLTARLRDLLCAFFASTFVTVAAPRIPNKHLYRLDFAAERTAFRSRLLNLVELMDGKQFGSFPVKYGTCKLYHVAPFL